MENDKSYIDEVLHSLLNNPRQDKENVDFEPELSESQAPATLLKKKLWHWCFTVKFEKLLRAPFLQSTSG